MKYACEARRGRGLGARRARRYLVATLALLAGGLPLATPAAAQTNPFAGRGMWIWYVGDSNGGSVSSIASQARAHGIQRLIIKAGDGSSIWSQFTAHLVATLHADGIRVCAWQYVYGNHPLGEASVGAAAVRNGADCLVIDAEGEYSGKYVQAQQYLAALRKSIGANFPVALAGLPYVDYHPGFPYSVFLGPGGAQYNMPQMYWRDIGTSVDRVYAHTFIFNRLYGRPIDPLGETTGAPPSSQIVRFRQDSLGYDTAGINWWLWQDTTSSGWQALSVPIGLASNLTADTAFASLGKGAEGDVVVWAQEHLVSAGQRIAVDGAFGPKTMAAVERFQAAHGLAETGLVSVATWHSLLSYRPAFVHWSLRRQAATASASGLTFPVPKNASLRGRNEFHRAPPGAGRPPGVH